VALLRRKPENALVDPAVVAGVGLAGGRNVAGQDIEDIIAFLRSKQ